MHFDVAPLNQAVIYVIRKDDDDVDDDDDDDDDDDNDDVFLGIIFYTELLNNSIEYYSKIYYK